MNGTTPAWKQIALTHRLFFECAMPTSESSPQQKETGSSSSLFPGEPIDTVNSTAESSYARPHPLIRAFDRFAATVTRWAGSPLAFSLAVLIVIVWAASGPLFHYSDVWQLVINTGTTIITFLMVFLIQQSQNKDSVAVHLKLNELIASHKAADNQLIGIEDASEEQLRTLADFYNDLAERAKQGEAVKPATLPGHIAALLKQTADKRIITDTTLTAKDAKSLGE